MQISNESFGIKQPVADVFPKLDNPARFRQLFEFAQRLFSVQMFDTAWAATLIMLIMNSFDESFNKVWSVFFLTYFSIHFMCMYRK